MNGFGLLADASRRFLAATLFIVLSACASEVIRQPTALKPLESTSAADQRLVKQNTPVKFNTGFERVIRKDTAWKLVGNIPQGAVYAPSAGVFSIEGAHVHEAYLVMIRGILVGFYLPVEQSFAPLKTPGNVHLWEE